VKKRGPNSRSLAAASSGEETCPTWAGTGLREQHISGDIVYAVRHQWRLTGDRAWLKSVGAPIVMGVAQFWASRVTENPDGTFSINDVIPPDEYHDHVNDRCRGSPNAPRFRHRTHARAAPRCSVFTNAVAALSLTFASELCAEFGVTGCDPTWPTIAAALRMPFDAVNQRFLEFANYTGDTIKQADVVLLDYPLELNLSETVRRNDLDYYGARTDPNGPAMTWSMHAIGYLALGDRTNGDSFFRRAYSQYLQPPFRVWWETPQGGCENFLTGAGGFLQALLFGYPGLRVTDHGLVFTDPQLPPGVTRFAVRGADYQGTRFGVAIDADGVSFTLGTVGDPPLCVTASGGASPTPLANGLRLAGLAGFTVAPCGTQG
jgi:trehalose/maltose hydrolase-like predicted phosphorylase